MSISKLRFAALAGVVVVTTVDLLTAVLALLVSREISFPFSRACRLSLQSHATLRFRTSVAVVAGIPRALIRAIERAVQLELSMAPSADPSAVDDGKTIEQLREELAELRAEKDASGCCPFNSAGDKDIYGRKFTLPVNNRAAVAVAAAAARSTQQPNTYCPRVVHRSTLSTSPRPSTSSRTPSRTCVRSTARGSISFQDS